MTSVASQIDPRDLEHAAGLDDVPLHSVYLPYTEEVLKRHFAPVRGLGQPRQKLDYYRVSADRTREHEKSHGRRRKGRVTSCASIDHQIEKDERFWIVTTLLRAFYANDRETAVVALLADALGATPPSGKHADWSTALGPVDDLRLFFEVSLPSPPLHSRWLAEQLDTRVPIPWLRARARSIVARNAVNPPLEGATKADAVLISPSTGFAVIFEAKVLSDASTDTTFNSVRNQIARTIDVMLNENENLLAPLSSRDPTTTCFVLLTPKVFKDNPGSRLYGYVMNAYRFGTGQLQADLPHRTPEGLRDVPGRLGWTTWERCNELLPGACPWLDAV